MKRAWRIGAIVAALTAACIATSPSLFVSPASAATNAPAARAKTVTVVLAPYLTWDDISATSTPAIMRLAEAGAVANVNARTHAKTQGQPAAPIECALAISAGAWLQPDWRAPSAYVATETFPGGGTAADAYQRIFGGELGSARIAYLGQPMTQRVNEDASVDARLGALGSAVRDAGGLTAAIGNSDSGSGSGEANAVPQRPSAVAAADMSGTVLYGDVSPAMLSTAAASPYGRHTDLVAFRDALGRVRLLEAAHTGPSLVILDAGDMSRAHDFAWQVTPEVAEKQHAEAVSTLDAVVGLVDGKRTHDDVVIVVSQALAADATGALEGLGPFVAAGPGFSGFATSSSTHRSGIVTNLDVPATVLDALGIARPVEMQGNAVTVTQSKATVQERIALLDRNNATAIAIDSAKPVVHNSLIWSCVAIMALVGLLVWRGGRWSPAARGRMTAALEGAILLVLSVPVANTLMFAFVRWPGSSAVALAAFAGATLLAWFAALTLAWRRSVRVAVIGLALLSSAGFVADQLAGAPLSFTSFLGYSPLLGARFYGMGNEVASLLFGGLIIALGLAFDAWPGTALTTWLRRYGVPLAGLVMVGAAAAPMLGANIGVAVWGTIGFGLAWALANGRRISWRLALTVALAAVLVVAAFSVADLLGQGEQTHLGRAIAGAQEGGPSTLLTIIARKADANARVLANTDLTWILVAALGLFAFARWRKDGEWPALLAENPGLMAMSLAAGIGGVVAFFSEDSGIVIPSLIAIYVGLALATRLLARVRDGDPT